MLEYFEGILFLTTNRQQDMDEAFANRIHITMKFPGLTPEMRMEIWRNLVNTNCNAKQPEKSWTEEVYQCIGKLDVNVR
jgi:hypothetical protein